MDLDQGLTISKIEMSRSLKILHPNPVLSGLLLGVLCEGRKTDNVVDSVFPVVDCSCRVKAL